MGPKVLELVAIMPKKVNALNILLKITIWKSTFLKKIILKLRVFFF